MKCYEEPRKTNEETDTCASQKREYMKVMQKELVDKTVRGNQWLELCTDKCKDEQDMDCINNCGTQYM